MKRPEGFDAPTRASLPATPRTGREQSRIPAKTAQPSQPAKVKPAKVQSTTSQPAKNPPPKAQPQEAAAQPRGKLKEGTQAAGAARSGTGATEHRKRNPDAAAGGSSRPGSGGEASPRGARPSNARKPHPPAPRGPRTSKHAGSADPAPTIPSARDGDPHARRVRRRIGRPGRRPLSPEAEARRAARQRRRFERGEIRRFTRRSRNRRLAWMAGLVLVVGMFGGVAAAVFSPLFALQRIDVRGVDRVDSTQVHAALEDQLGTPLALLDERAIRERLSAFPLIRSFITELVPPDTIVIRITERQPVGAIPSGSGFDLTDPAGVVVQSVQQRPGGMPLIDVGGEGVPSTAFRSAAEVLLALPDDLAARVDTVRARTKDDVTLVLTGSDQRVLWGSAEESLAKARALAGLVAQHGGDGPGQYDVSAPQTVVFRAD